MRVEERTADLAVANVRLQDEVAERKEAQAELQWHYHQADRARSESAAILDATGEAMILISPEHWVLSVNRRFTRVLRDCVNPRSWAVVWRTCRAVWNASSRIPPD